MRTRRHVGADRGVDLDLGGHRAHDDAVDPEPLRGPLPDEPVAQRVPPSDAARIARQAGVPLVAIGGITLDRAASVIEAGAASVAVIGDLLSTSDPEGRTRAFLERIAGIEGV